MGKIDLANIADLRNIDWTLPISGSSDGILPKSVITKGNRKFYLKLGSYSEPYGFYGIEPIMELVNSRIGYLLRLPVLDFSLLGCIVNINGRQIKTIASISKDYKGTSVGISIEKWYSKYRNGNELPIDTIRRYGLQYQIYKQFLFDYIICNLDRHGKNTEVLVGNNISSLDIAPFFDNSLTFITNRPENEIKDKVQFNDRARVNNYIGTMNLAENIHLIDRYIKVRTPKDSDRQMLFQGLASVTTRQFRDYVWYTFNRRIQNVKSERIPFIQWE